MTLNEWEETKSPLMSISESATQSDTFETQVGNF